MSLYCFLYSSTADNGEMVGANMSKKPWDRALIKLKIVFIHKNVQFGTGPILLNKMGLDFRNCVHILKLAHNYHTFAKAQKFVCEMDLTTDI